MRKLGKYFLIFVLVIGGILIAGAAFLRFVNLDPFRERIGNMATRAIGRQLDIHGQLKINLFPYPELIVNDVRLANAKWGTEPTMASVGHGEIAVSFLSLFSDTIIVRRLRLKEVTVLLERNDQQVGNWTMRKAATTADTAERSGRDAKQMASLPLLVEMVEFDNITAIVRAPERTDQVYHMSSLGLEPDASGNLILTSSGELLGLPMTLDAEITSKASLLANGAVKFDLQASLGDARLTGQLATTRLATLAGLSGNFNITVKDLQKALDKAQIKAPIAGSLNADIEAVKTANGSDVTVKANLDGAHADATARIVDARLRDVDLKLTIDDLKKTLDAADVKIPLTGPLTADATLKIDNSIYRATVETTVDGMTCTADGSYTGKQLDLNSTLTPLSRVGELLGLQGIRADALDLKAKVVHSADHKLEIKQIEAIAGDNRLAADGRINMSGESNLSFTLESPNLNGLLDTLPAIDLNAKASAQYSAEKIIVSELAVTFDKSDINGDFSMLRGDKRVITANLTSTLLDLRRFSESAKRDDDQKKVPDKAVSKSSTEAKAVPAKRNVFKEKPFQPAPIQYVFKEKPFQLAPIQKVEADFKLAVAQFYYDKSDWKDAKIDASLHKGKVDAKLKYTADNASRFAAKIDLDTQGKKATLSTVVSMSDYRLNVLKTERLKPEELPPTSMSLELKTAGSSPREWASGANGKILLTQGAGKVDNKMRWMFAGDFFAQLASALNPLAKEDEFSIYDCTVISLNIVDGKANIDGMLSQSEKIMIIGGGDIDLNTEQLNIEFNTKPRSGVGIRPGMFVTPFIKLKGTLARPEIGLNEKGTLLEGGAAVATGGLSFFLKGAFDRTTAREDQCEKTMQYVGDHTRYSF